MIKIIAVFALGMKLLHFRCGWLKAAQSAVSLIGPKGTLGLFYRFCVKRVNFQGGKALYLQGCRVRTVQWEPKSLVKH